MFLGLDKIYNQGLKKVIVSVPERTIGKSFAKTELKKVYFTDWDYDDKYNLCTLVMKVKFQYSKISCLMKIQNINLYPRTLRHSYNQLKARF